MKVIADMTLLLKDHGLLKNIIKSEIKSAIVVKGV